MLRREKAGLSDVALESEYQAHSPAVPPTNKLKQEDLFARVPASHRVTCPPESQLNPDVCAARHGGADTSAAAYDSTPAAARAVVRERIRRTIAESAGLTCEEVERDLHLSHQTASARISELSREGFIRDSGQRRKTSSGRTARVYQAGKA